MHVHESCPLCLNSRHFFKLLPTLLLLHVTCSLGGEKSYLCINKGELTMSPTASKTKMLCPATDMPHCLMLAYLSTSIRSHHHLRPSHTVRVFPATLFVFAFFLRAKLFPLPGPSLRSRPQPQPHAAPTQGTPPLPDLGNSAAQPPASPAWSSEDLPDAIADTYPQHPGQQEPALPLDSSPVFGGVPGIPSDTRIPNIC